MSGEWKIAFVFLFLTGILVMLGALNLQQFLAVWGKVFAKAVAGTTFVSLLYFLIKDKH
jgi:hypothetical protein